MKKLILILCVTVTLMGCAMHSKPVQEVYLVNGEGCVPLGNVQASHYWPTPRKGDDKAQVINKMKRQVQALNGNGLIVEWYEDGVGQGIALHCPYL